MPRNHANAVRQQLLPKNDNGRKCRSNDGADDEVLSTRNDGGQTLMFFVPGFVISFLTFPGVIVHEAAHAYFCRMFKAPILEVKYFQFANPAGYVIHGEPENFKGQFFITMGPFIINSALCVLFCSAAFLPVGLEAWLARALFRLSDYRTTESLRRSKPCGSDCDHRGRH